MHHLQSENEHSDYLLHGKNENMHPLNSIIEIRVLNNSSLGMLCQYNIYFSSLGDDTQKIL